MVELSRHVVAVSALHTRPNPPQSPFRRLTYLSVSGVRLPTPTSCQGNYDEEEPKKTGNADLPSSRVKKIMTIDPAVKKIHKNAVIATVRTHKSAVGGDCRWRPSPALEHHHPTTTTTTTTTTTAPAAAALPLSRHHSWQNLVAAPKNSLSLWAARAVLR
jgi:hypothetical protein